jgi:hypothetical protein
MQMISSAGLSEIRPRPYRVNLSRYRRNSSKRRFRHSVGVSCLTAGLIRRRKSADHAFPEISGVLTSATSSAAHGRARPILSNVRRAMARPSDIMVNLALRRLERSWTSEPLRGRRLGLSAILERTSPLVNQLTFARHGACYPACAGDFRGPV